jgi:pyroglutamyl-peptidase
MSYGSSRILISGFGPFPGAPRNPTMAIVRHLLRSHSSRFQNVELLAEELPTKWSILDHFTSVIEGTKPDAILMFGLSGRRLKISVEKRAINRALMLRSDVAGKKPNQLQLKKGASDFQHSSFDAARMTAAMVQAGLKARPSNDAGTYLCNALLWTALESGVPSIFVHVPLPVSAHRPKRDRASRRMGAQALARAGEVALSEVLKALKKR